MKNFSKLGFFKALGIIAIVAIIGIGLAGCNNDQGKPAEYTPPPSGTVKLTGTAVNTFTLTLTGLTWGNDRIADMFRTNSRYILDLDGPVTANGDPAVVTNPGDLNYTVVRTSDTVVTVTISALADYGPNHPWGSGKIKLNSLSLRQFLSPYLSNFDSYKLELTLAADSGSANFNIPKGE
ncbi:hypothetical protein FACS1894124_4930 [Spirochaetia bacterium]|nr:hypothetical protein FACS1894124_4930 [Spirochaetia bacterium]